MTTALSIINRAAELIGYKDPDEALSGNESESFLGALNALVDSWNTRRLYIVTVADTTVSVSASPVTIGAGQTVNVTRPVRIEDGSFTRFGGIDYAIEMLTREQYNSITDKTVTSSFPTVAYYDAGLPTGMIYLWPVPTAAIELHLMLQSQLAQFADLATDYSIAPGYRRALEYSLAEEIAPGRRPLETLIARTAANARKMIRTANFESPQLNEYPRYDTAYVRFLSGV